MSHSLRVRGLKPTRHITLYCIADVALPTSAWIETTIEHNDMCPFASRTPYECVDWNTLRQIYHKPLCKSHSLRVRGLKQSQVKKMNTKDLVALPTSAWIETADGAFRSISGDVALPTSAWIETSVLTTSVPFLKVALPTSAWIETVRMLKQN